MQPVFLITIDTEGDDLWSRPEVVTTKNARHLPRFQALCERYGLKPTYLTNYEMATDLAFAEFAADAQKRGAAEIGMHLHAWNSPPAHALTDKDYWHQPYLYEYPENIIRAKIRAMTNTIEERFGRPVSHRAGRWAMTPTYARALIDEGYTIDCSVTPGASWRRYPGAPWGRGGSDYTRYPTDAYFLNLDDLSCPGRSPLLEVPMTTRTRRNFLLRYIPPALGESRVVTAALDRVAPVRWLRPRRGKLSELLALVADIHAQHGDYAEFMLHSSELMPGGSPYFPRASDIDELYGDLERLFSFVAGRFVGATLAEYRERFPTGGK